MIRRILQLLSSLFQRDLAPVAPEPSHWVPTAGDPWVKEILVHRAQDLDSPGLDWTRSVCDEDDGFDDEEEREPPASALATALARFPEDEHAVLLLAAIDRWTSSGSDGLLNFLVLPYSEFLPQTVGTLGILGLTEHVEIIMAAVSRFGGVSQTVADRYRRWSDGHGTILDPALDADVRALSDQFKALPRPLQYAVARIEADPVLSARYAALRQELPERDKLRLLINYLYNKMADGDNWQKILQWPTEQSDILIIYLFHLHIREHSFHDFFLSSSGNFAPELVLAFQRWNLPEMAEAMAAGIALYPSPYPRSIDARNNFADQQDEDFEDMINELEDFDENELYDVQYRIARAGGLFYPDSALPPSA